MSSKQTHGPGWVSMKATCVSCARPTRYGSSGGAKRLCICSSLQGPLIVPKTLKLLIQSPTTAVSKQIKTKHALSRMKLTHGLVLQVQTLSRKWSIFNVTEKKHGNKSCMDGLVPSHGLVTVWSRLVTGRVLLIIYWTFIFGHDRSRPVTVQYGHMCDGKIWQSATSFVIHDTHDTSHSIIHEKG